MLSPESLGIDQDIHGLIFEREKKAFSARKAVTTSLIPEVLDVINSPGVVAACNQLVGENWAIVPFTHNAPFVSGSHDQHWHKDDNGPYNGRKQRHHQAVQIEMLYYPQEVREDMGPTATVPYSHYWTFNHEENHDNFAGADHLDFGYQLNGMERVPVSGPKTEYDENDIVQRRTPHDIRMRDAVNNLNWPLASPFEAAPLLAGSVILHSHNLLHRGNHRRDDWRTWKNNPRFMWRFWLYRTTDPAPASGCNGTPEEISWRSLGVDPLTNVDLAETDEDVTVVWRHHFHWLHTGRVPPPRPEALACTAEEQREEADRLGDQLHWKHDAAEPARIGAAYRLACIGDTALAVQVLGRALYNDRESVRRAATYGLTAVGPDATSTFLDATKSPVKWVRKAGVYGLGDASALTPEVLGAVVTRLQEDPSVYVRSVAAGALGCLGRRAAGTGVGKSLIPACLDALVQSLAGEENRLGMDRAQERSIKFVRPTDECDVCEGIGVDYGVDRFEPVRSAVRENALWSIVILCSHGSVITDRALEPTVRALTEVVRNDRNVFCVGFAMDALNRLANLRPTGEEVQPIIRRLQENVSAIFKESPIRSRESLARGCPSSAAAESDQSGF